MYRYVAAASVACMICITHLLVNQAFLPAQNTDTGGRHPSTVDDDAVIDASDTSRMFNDEDALNWVVRHDTGCDDIERDDSDNVDHVVCHLCYCGYTFLRTFHLSLSCVNFQLIFVLQW